MLTDPDDRNATLAKDVAALLNTEFKIFKEMCQAGVDIASLVKDHCRIYRTFEQEELVKEVSQSDYTVTDV